MLTIRFLSSLKYRLVFVLLFAFAILVALSLSGKVGVFINGSYEKKAKIAGKHYVVPSDYSRTMLADGGDAISLDVTLDTFRPSLNTRPGWRNDVLILVKVVNNTTADLWDSFYDGTSIMRGPYQDITRQYEMPSGLVVREYRDGWDSIINPNAKLDENLSFMICFRPESIKGFAPSCSLYFDRNGQRWDVTFGRQFVDDYTSIRQRAENLIDSFEVE